MKSLKCITRKEMKRMREDTFIKNQHLAQLKVQRQKVKAQISLRKSQRKALVKELGAVSLQEARAVIQARLMELDAEINELDQQLLTLKMDVLEVWHGQGFALLKLLVPCGKDCKKCPHGPYWRAIWREGKPIMKHIGPAEGPKALSKDEALAKAYALRWPQGRN
jgi:seryl-tRNA synthetase